MDIELHYLGRVWRLSDQASSKFDLTRRPGHVSGKLRGSVTASGTALMRAIHTRTDADPLIDDPWGERLVPEEVVAAYQENALEKRGKNSSRITGFAARQAALDEHLAASRTYSNVILRTRYAEDALQQATLGGALQYVIIGAGFDSFGLRQLPFAGHISVFEIDLPATQSLKLQRLADCGIALPESLHFVAANLTEEDLAAVLSRAAFNSVERTFFSWLGVTMFLTREANRSTLAAIARCAAPGSELVFTYLDQNAFQFPSESFRAIQASARDSGEPLLSGFDPCTLGDDLRQLGFDLIEDLSDAEVLARLSPTNTNKMRPLAHARMARARVSQRLETSS